jgi:hypothetical protein
MIAARPALACFAAAAAWPPAMMWLSHMATSPLERAVLQSWCGAPQYASQLLGHCTVCWTGSALLVAAGIWLLWRARPAVRLGL